ncbi:MAG: glycosyltransferase [Actinobacteria bacterium]|nr:glycosyltransferase [Actinomycetota bacterium]
MIAPAFLPAYAHGGVPRSSFHLAKGLAELGHDVRVIASNRNGSARLDVEPDRFADFQGLSVCYCSASAGSFLHSRTAQAILAEELKSSDCVLHQGTTWTHFGLLSAQWARHRKDQPYVIWPRGVLSPAALSISPIRKKVYWSLCMRSWYARARAIVATMPSEVDQITRLGFRKRIEVIPNAVDTASLSDGLTRPELDQRYPQLRGKQITLSLGRLCPIKGLRHLIDAFSLIKQRFDQVVLVIAGPEEHGYKGKLQTHARSLGLNGSVLFTGRVQGRNKVGLLRSAKVLAMPSDSESFGMSAAEAAACGTPVVLTPQCGIAPFLTGAQAGITVSQQPAQIADAINTLLADDDLSLTMGQNGRQLIQDEFSWPKVAKRTDALLSELVC